jgi:hypothetical protein
MMVRFTARVCRLNQHYPPGMVLAHLTCKCIITTYKDWMYHGVRPVWGHVEGSPLNHPAADAASASSEQGGNMHAMLCDVFGMHDVKGDNCESQVILQGDEIFVDEEVDQGDV